MSQAYIIISLGWVAIVTAVTFQFVLNRRLSSPAAIAPFDFTENFSGRLADHWETLPESGLGNTCIYPDVEKISAGKLVLPVQEQRTLCFGRLRRFLGSMICSKERFTPPFSVTARMQTASGAGVMSALYTYTDPLDGNPHFESDFEFPSPIPGHTNIWINQYSPSVRDPLFGEPRLYSGFGDTSQHAMEYTVEVYSRHTIFKVGNKVLYDWKLNYESFPQKVCLNSWFATKWQKLYSGVLHKKGGDPFTVEWVHVKSMTESLL